MSVFRFAKKNKTRCNIYVCALIVSLFGIFRSAVSGEERRDASASQAMGVLCRWIDAKGALVLFHELKLAENQKGTVSSTSKSPFVIGATPEGKANRPYIVVIEDGLRIDVLVGGRRPDGASVDITVEQSKIGQVETKKVDNDLTIQKPHVDIVKKRALDFVKYGEIFSIPIGNRDSASRVELILQADAKTTVPVSWILPVKEDSAKAKQAEIFGKILTLGGTELRCEERGYSVRLFEGPVLLQNIRLLSGIRELQNLTITSKDYNYALMHELTKIYVQHDLELLDAKGEKKAQSEEIGEDRLVWHLHHDAPGYAKLTLEAADPPPFTVYVDDVEAAIPVLQKAAHIKRVHIIGVHDEDATKAAQAKQLMQKALPHTKIETFVFTGGNRPIPR